VAANQSIAGPLVALNTIVAESLDYIATELERATGGDSGKLSGAVQTLLSKIINEHGRVIFNGDNYADEWHQEAERRGLPNLKTTVEALPTLINTEVVECFNKYGVLSPREVQSRHDIYTEQYVKSILTEARLTIEMATTMIYPAASKYLGDLASTAAALKGAGLKANTKMLEEVSSLTDGLLESVATLQAQLDHHSSSLTEEAKHCGYKILPAMNEVRSYSDRLEAVVADNLWPLPTYQEMLFIK
jgi:glutamine synthetase